ncbi:hypothetical protein Tco_1458843 [Tanacetum coccineum]
MSMIEDRLSHIEVLESAKDMDVGLGGNDSAEQVSGGANGFVNVSLLNSATSLFGSTFVEISGEFIALMFGEVLREGASLSIEEEDAPTVSGGSRVAAEMV